MHWGEFPLACGYYFLTEFNANGGSRGCGRDPSVQNMVLPLSRTRTRSCYTPSSKTFVDKTEFEKRRLKLILSVTCVCMHSTHNIFTAPSFARSSVKIRDGIAEFSARFVLRKKVLAYFEDKVQLCQFCSRLSCPNTSVPFSAQLYVGLSVDHICSALTPPPCLCVSSSCGTWLGVSWRSLDAASRYINWREPMPKEVRGGKRRR